MSLYDWIRKAKKEKRTKEEQQEFDAHYDKNENEVESDDESVTEGEYELNFLGGGATTCDIEDESIDELLGEDSDDELNNYENFYDDEPDSQEFLPDHPQHCTHKVVVVDEENALLLAKAYLAVIKVTENITVLLCFLCSNLGEMAKI
jgi:hypothetical protein